MISHLRSGTKNQKISNTPLSLYESLTRIYTIYKEVGIEYDDYIRTVVPGTPFNITHMSTPKSKMMQKNSIVKHEAQC